MAIETRGGKLYYYRKQRRGSRVCSIYAGAGTLALQAFKQDLDERKRRQAERDSLCATMEKEGAIERQLASAENTVRRILRATLEAEGFHQHKGTWRKKRK